MQRMQQQNRTGSFTNYLNMADGGHDVSVGSVRSF